MTTRVAVKERKRVQRINEQEKKYNQFLFKIDDFQERLILDFDNEGNARVEVDSVLVEELKPHQREGIKFMYNSTIENVDKLRKGDEGSGCILAHCMGLGKTFQSIAFVHTILSNSLTKDHFKTILIGVPVNVLKNWIEEIDKWISEKGLKSFEVHEINDETTTNARLKRLTRWHRKGGVMVIGQTLLGRLTNLSDSKQKISSLEIKFFEEYLVDPGPDMVIIDEGHKLKSSVSLISQGVNSMRTRRKIMLSGTPLQNNLKEYYTLIDIIKPGLLGSEKQFARDFRGPIEVGQKADSTELNFTFMKRRAAVLHKILAGTIQRFDFETLKHHLEPKFEYALVIRPTELMAQMYNYFLNELQTMRILSDVAEVRYLLSHPGSFYLRSPRDRDEEANEDDWYKQFVGPEDWKKIELSGKFVLLFKILEKCITVGDKLVVASQSITTLDLIEKFLVSSLRPFYDNEGEKIKWELDINYFRIDGSIKAETRQDQIGVFNDPENKEARLFLVSTKAGGIGINLTGANRCVIFDVSWNPSDDIQAIFRIYRLGQIKPVYVYRFVIKDTMEEVIFRKQVMKLGMAIRVVDKRQVKRLSTTFETEEYYKTRPEDDYPVPILDVPKDRLLADILHTGNDQILDCIEFDSLLEKRPEEELTEEERLAAWVEYEKGDEVELGSKSRPTNSDNANGKSSSKQVKKSSADDDDIQIISDQIIQGLRKLGINK